jgi:pimeloyl-ACP methyl ester carboxylesterase
VVPQWLPQDLVLLIHGLGGSRTDTLPAMSMLGAQGFPLLAITYRNDVGAAPSPDHRSHLGDTEWHDIEAAVRFALTHGADGIVLYGWSLGAGLAIVLSEQSPVRDKVRALVLDSPLLDWPATLAYAAQRRELPRVILRATQTMLDTRWSVRLDRYDTARLSGALTTPTLVVQGTADTIVPPATTDVFARSRPDLITYLRVPGANHISAVDTDPATYADVLCHMLASLR